MTAETKEKPQNGQAKTTALAVTEKNIVEKVQGQLNTLQQRREIQFPKDYSVANALKSAYLTLTETNNKDGKPVLTECTPASIANALLKMVVRGLTPMKAQCFFIAHGKMLAFYPSYQGNVALAKRAAGIKRVNANIIYQGDEFEYATDKNGVRSITKHVSRLENVDPTKIAGAYAVVIQADDTPYLEIMNMAQIRKAWNQGPMKGESPAHKNFPDQMCLKTVISRACKSFINQSNDADLYEDFDDEIVHNAVAEEVKEHANRETLSIEPASEEVAPPAEKELSKEEKNRIADEETGQDKPGF